VSPQDPIVPRHAGHPGRAQLAAPGVEDLDALLGAHRETCQEGHGVRCSHEGWLPGEQDDQDQLGHGNREPEDRGAVFWVIPIKVRVQFVRGM
jgi:hypothetical protein